MTWSNGVCQDRLLLFRFTIVWIFVGVAVRYVRMIGVHVVTVVFVVRVR